MTHDQIAEKVAADYSYEHKDLAKTVTKCTLNFLADDDFMPLKGLLGYHNMFYSVGLHYLWARIQEHADESNEINVWQLKLIVADVTSLVIKNFNYVEIDERFNEL